jgi:hypothetical protein
LNSEWTTHDTTKIRNHEPWTAERKAYRVSRLRASINHLDATMQALVALSHFYGVSLLPLRRDKAVGKQPLHDCGPVPPRRRRAAPPRAKLRAFPAARQPL